MNTLWLHVSTLPINKYNGHTTLQEYKGKHFDSKSKTWNNHQESIKQKSFDLISYEKIWPTFEIQMLRC